VVSTLQVSDQNFVYILISPFVLHAPHPILLDLIILILVKSTSYEALHHVVFSILPPLPPSQVQILHLLCLKGFGFLLTRLTPKQCIYLSY